MVHVFGLLSLIIKKKLSELSPPPLAKLSGSAHEKYGCVSNICLNHCFIKKWHDRGIMNVSDLLRVICLR